MAFDTSGFLSGKVDGGKMAKRHERDTAKALGGRTTIGSGNKGMKGDVQTAQYMVENKATGKQSLSLKLDWLIKLRREARAARLEPALHLRFDGPDEEWVLVRAEHFKELADG